MEHDDEWDDPVFAGFMALLAEHIENHPEEMVALSQEFFDRIEKMLEGLEVDPDDPLEGEVDL